jgi:hypothetical protein
VAHEYHLKSKSFSEHKALNGFYNDMLDFADEFVETYQGQYGILTDYSISTKPVHNILEYMEDCVRVFSAGREELEDPHLQNIIDEVVSLTYRTIYKLKFLK